MMFFRFYKRINITNSYTVFETRGYPVFKLKSCFRGDFLLRKTLRTNNTYFSSSEVFSWNQCRSLQPGVVHHNFSTASAKDSGKIPDNTQQGNGHKKISRKEQLKIAVRDYGATVIVFHVGISLTSLGICYLLISNGLDAAFVLKAVGFSESIISSKVAVGGSTFVIAYAVHKLFAPLRIAITLSATPFIVRYLRRIGVLKLPKS